MPQRRTPSQKQPKRDPITDQRSKFRPKGAARDLKKKDRQPLKKAREGVRIRRALADDNLPQNLPVRMLSMPAMADYELIDSGFGKKLERYGKYLIVRPEEQAIWQPSLPENEWEKADAVFTGSDDEEENGRWRFQNRLSGAGVEEAFSLTYGDIHFHSRFTAFRHMGFFPEQAAHWEWFSFLIKAAKRPIKVLNLFGYTGVASLVAAKAGASVTHIDASKKAIGWARENQSLSGLQEAPIRWICEDASKFIHRTEKREDLYDAVILDPPKYGRGPNGEVWQYFEDLPELMHRIRRILSDQPLFVLLSSYAIRASYLSSHELCRDVFAGLGGTLQSGELVIPQSGTTREISTSLYTRWSRESGLE